MLNTTLPCKTRLNCNGNIEIYSSSNGLDYFICNSCGLIWRDPKSNSSLESYEKEYQKKYEKRFSARIHKSHRHLDIIEAHFGIGNLFTVGSSLGYFIIAAGGRGWNTKGLDISSYATEECQKKGLNVQQGSLENLKLNEVYDVVVMRHVLEHFPDPFSTLDDINNMLRPKGGIFITVPNANYSKSRKLRGEYKGFQPDKKGKEHFVYFNYDTLRKVLNATGFEVLQENYPVFVRRSINPIHTLERLIRKLEHTINLDKEILVLAQKKP